MLDDYDAVLIDCPPSLGVLTINGLTAAEAVIVPLQCEALSHRGVGQLLETIEDVRQFANEKLRVLGVIPTMFDARTTHSRQVLSEVEDRYGLPLFQPSVPKSVRFAEAPGLGQSVLQHAPTSPGAVAYRTLSTRSTTRCRPPEERGVLSERPGARSAGEAGPVLGAVAGGAGGADEGGAGTVALPIGKRALYSAATAEPDSLALTSGNPLDERGSFTVVCARCRQTSHIGVLDLLIFQFPLGVWFPRSASTTA